MPAGVLFLVDLGSLARQTKNEFDAYASPYKNYKFGEEYIVQHLQRNLQRYARLRWRGRFRQYYPIK